MTTLLDDAVEKLKNGITTCEEILRVFGPQNTAEIACPHCDGLMEQRHRFCPYCGRELVRTCEHCQQLLARDWRHCPKCGQIQAPAAGIEMGKGGYDDSEH
jgi:RNA polymerase subunit RPABC4/transcription elongation factor Spt4